MVVLRHVQCMAITLTLSHDRNITLSGLIYPARELLYRDHDCFIAITPTFQIPIALPR